MDKTPSRSMAVPVAAAAGQAPGWLAPALAGFAATLLGLGLARFAYTPLLPALVQEGWLTSSQAAYLGAANLLGYLVGALAAAPLGGRFGNRAVLRGAMALAALSLLACAWNGGLVWLSVWRIVAGATGAVLIVLAGPTVVAPLPLAVKARAIGVVFTGIGVGVVLAGLGVPLLAGAGVSAAWLVVGALALLLTLAAWPHWPGPVARPAGAGAPVKVRSAPLWLSTLAYAGDGIGYVPHTLFFADFVARGLGQGVAVGGYYWALFGAGAACGAVFGGWLGARFGFPKAFALLLTVKGLAVALPLASTTAPTLALSIFVAGLLTPGSVAVASGVSALLAGAGGHVRAWGRMTAAFALTQAVGGYAMSALYAATGSHRPLFAVGAVTLLAGAACAWVALRFAKEEVP
ncbi:YbfB/YjiJ family MFS transporter [Aerophototrophica crusticola]|uniref:YbfB/YjiJ family MFS transporter n=1 Tax=Aerophototrophica crusticola TaxID=1709002 RepID=A0A858R7J0_9PROT|nr:YbfB/YjiJ family MFS transporter [Rhodospirillaceae bacterium B3]